MRHKSCVGLVAEAIVFVVALALTASARAAGVSVFLVARPEMPDPLFAQSVILMVPHTNDFPLVVGLIVNKPISQMPLHELFPGSSMLKNRSDTAFFGGPVEIETPAIIFRSDQAIDKAVPLAGDVYVSLDPDLAAALAQDPKRTHNFRLVLGRAQWITDQLHSEIMRGAWYMVSADAGIVFSANPGGMWATLVARARSIPAVTSAGPRGAPSLFGVSSEEPPLSPAIFP
jgi:putative transcriptional regulator